MLKQMELAKIANNLQVPVIIGDMMDHPSKFNEAVQYALHDLLSDMLPDSALLSIALSARTICASYASASASMKVMAMECTRIINEYGQIEIRNLNDGMIEDYQAKDTLMDVSEDLEGLAEFLELNIEFLKSKDDLAYRIFEILLVQAQAQLLIAEEFCNALTYVIESNIHQRVEEKSDAPMRQVIAKQATNDALRLHDNVIAFPGTQQI